MRILELEINNVRGICHLLLQPQGENFVLWGPNGSGKSAVVDALDFLLTGRVTRLTGRGTGSMSLQRHGPHIDHNPDEAMVRAVIRLQDMAKPVEISRCMARPSQLEIDPPIGSRLEAVLTLARRGQHVLTRREILRFITSDAGTRAQEIQELLNISDVEEIRKTFVRVSNDFARNVDAARRAVDTAKAAVNATVQETTYETDRVLEIVNGQRALLGGQPITHLKAADLKKDLGPPRVMHPGLLMDVSLFDGHASNLRATLLADRQTQIAANDTELRTLITEVRSNPDLERAFRRQELIKLGIALVDESGTCPLCDTPWAPGELRSYLEQRLATAQLAAQHYTRISELSSKLLGPTNAAIVSLQSVIQTAGSLEIEQDVLSTLESWCSDLQDLASRLSSPLDGYPDGGFSVKRVGQMLAPQGLEQILQAIAARITAQHPQITPEQRAWDVLTALEENLKGLEQAQSNLGTEQNRAQSAGALLRCFQEARDTVLGRLYDDVRDRFVDLYRRIHGPDEDGFAALLHPSGAGLDFEVDFYNRGTHPPHALHSEGHQDSMGLCLFLALADELTQDVMDLIILDDVMMSIDADHRRELCHLLAESFPHRQFLITTHDRTWASQLKCEGVVTSKGSMEFYSWNVSTGPQVNYEADMWVRIEEDLARHNVADAAAKLRRGSEGFFSLVCDSLRVPVVFKLSHRWELGDLLPSAMGHYRKLLKQAKKAAQSWGDRARFDALDEADSVVGQVFARSNAEQWAVNTNVHYNEWANFSENDFRPVVEAFQDLFELFTCSRCGVVLRLASVGFDPVAVQCGCGLVDWHLTERPRA